MFFAVVFAQGRNEMSRAPTHVICISLQRYEVSVEAERNAPKKKGRRQRLTGSPCATRKNFWATFLNLLRAQNVELGASCLHLFATRGLTGALPMCKYANVQMCEWRVLSECATRSWGVTFSKRPHGGFCVLAPSMGVTFSKRHVLHGHIKRFLAHARVIHRSLYKLLSPVTLILPLTPISLIVCIIIIPRKVTATFTRGQYLVMMIEKSVICL